MKQRKEIITLLSAHEPDYPLIISKLAKEDYETINKLTRHRSTAIATRAIICLGYLGTEEIMDGLVAAVKSENPLLRLTAAQALGKMKGANSNPEAVKLITELLNDGDNGVRKFALKTAAIVQIAGLKEQIKQVHDTEENIHIKKLADTVFWQLKVTDETHSH